MTLEPKKRKGQDPSSVEPVNRCTAHRKNGDACRNSAIRGSNVCRVHGGSAPQVKRAAQVRLMMAADRVAGQLLQIADDQKVPVQVRLAAMRDILDRAGLVATQQIALAAEVTTQTWEHRIDAAVVNWGELDSGNVIDAELVDDYEPQDATLDESTRPRPHLEQRRAQVEASVRRIADDEQPPWVTGESGAQSAKRLADEHRKAAFASEKASKGLTPRTTRRR